MHLGCGTRPEDAAAELKVAWDQGSGVEVRVESGGQAVAGAEDSAMLSVRPSPEQPTSF